MDLRRFLIQWNRKYPLDYRYRRKYHIGFNSSEHRKLNQIDIYLDWLEQVLYDEAIEEFKDTEQREKDVVKGIWLRDTEVSQEDEEALFNKLDVEI